MSQRWTALNRIADLQRQLEALALDLERLGVDPLEKAAITVPMARALLEAEQAIERATSRERSGVLGPRLS